LLKKENREIEMERGRRETHSVGDCRELCGMNTWKEKRIRWEVKLGHLLAFQEYHTLTISMTGSRRLWPKNHTRK